MKKSLCLILSAVILFSCGDNKTTPLRVVEISDKNAAGNFSSLIESYEVMPFDNRPEAYFRYATKITTTGSLWLFSQPNEGKIVAFDYKGNYLNTIGRKGRGPGEIGYINDFIYDKTDSTVTVYDNGKAKKFSLDGSFLGMQDLPFRPGRVAIFGNKYFVVNTDMPSAVKEANFELRVLDRNYSAVDQRIPLTSENVIGAALYGQSMRTGLNLDHAWYFSLSGDTIFHIYGDGKIKPAYKFSYDKDIFISILFTASNSGTDVGELQKRDIYKQLYYYEDGDRKYLFFQNLDKSYCYIFDDRNTGGKLFEGGFAPESISDNQELVVINSMYLKDAIDLRIDPGMKKCTNRDLLEKLIEKSTDDFQVLIRIKLADPFKKNNRF